MVFQVSWSLASGGSAISKWLQVSERIKNIGHCLCGRIPWVRLILYPSAIGQNSVLWPLLSGNEAGKGHLAVCAKEKEIAFLNS